MATEIIALDGCRPTPLAGYLKALGVLRLVSEQKDPQAAGFWRDERFHLRTELDRSELARFFLDEYAPSPIIAPWNGGSGFYPKDAKKGIEAFSVTAAERFTPYRRSIVLSAELIADRRLDERPTDTEKTELIAALRARADDPTVGWIDAAVALTIERLAFPPLLGTGGNDGRLDFTNNFMQRLVELFDTGSGSPRAGALELLDSSLFGEPVLGLLDVAIGQFSPGAAGGPNASAGYEGSPRVNPWDFVLMLEGVVLFAGGVSRRLEGADPAYLSYPFTVRAASAGFGTASLQEQTESRGEVWMPLWTRPTGLKEIRVLLCEGRLSLGARPARDGLDAARAVASLGADRRIAAFERYGFVKRQGLAYLATPLGRRLVRPNPIAELANDFDRRAWLERFRREAGPDAPAELREAARELEEALFQMTAPRVVASDGPEIVQAVLIAVGNAARCLAVRQRVWERLRPPPLLRSQWIDEAYDGSPEFRIAAALAWLHARSAEETERAAGEGTSGSGPGGRSRTILPMRCHLAPLHRRQGIDWDQAEGGALAVWGNGGLVANLCAVAQRRVIEQSRLGLAEKPFIGAIGVGSADIATFLEAGPAFYERITELLAGLVWVGWPAGDERAGLRAIWKTRPGPLPLAYAALKPLFSPDDSLKRLDLGLTENFALPIPPVLPGLLIADRVPDAMRLVMQRARSSGLPTPFMHAEPPSRPGEGRRLLAALTIPVRRDVLGGCIRHAYPAEEEPSDAA
ncbi:MAG: type I-U CRISPR-associated protein Csx17 [Alphaproteobacteria bacterium]